jgi:two-component system CheB/CheR fusion protein
MSAPEMNVEFEALLDYVKRSRGFDFTGYKRSTLMRRVSKRMQSLGISGYSDYTGYLETHPEEFLSLFNTLLINVTSFFRDRPTWDYLTSNVIPRLLTHKKSSEGIRAWSAGCATGEEAYSLAIALAEVIGIDQFREQVKIYATDVDEEALSHARQGIYFARDLEGVSPEILENYFERTENRYVFRKDMRRSVIFGRHDLIQDAPISKIDLLMCRNTLMYFNAETQVRILSRFHFALRDNGFLFLGKAEMLLTHSNTFTPLDLKHRIFSKVPKISFRDRLISMASSGQDEANHFLSKHIRLREEAFDHSSIAQIVVDVSGVLVLVNEQARTLFSVTLQDIGRPLQDLEISYRPAELRSCIDRAYFDRRAVTLQDIEWRLSQDELVYLDIQITPLINSTNGVLGASITFTDVTRYKRLQEEIQLSNQELEMAYEELQSTNEELETTNEELQSANEELETTNEELQSTNEELETMNEELQSTNEELQTVNDELQRRSEELNQSNSFLESILTSLKGGVVVINRDLQVQIWNDKAEDMWGLRATEAIGQNFLNLDIGLPVEQLRPSIRGCLADSSAGASELTLSAINRRGRTIQCRVTCTTLASPEREVQGVILLMEERED